MPKVSRETASESGGGPGLEARYEHFEGGYTVEFETFTEDVDLTPRLKGLPDDLCPSPHWGYVVSGRLTYNIGGQDEVIEGGEAFYVPAAHTLMGDAGTEVVFFSPTGVWRETLEAIEKNLERVG